MSTSAPAVLILAAGKGSRMKSDTPKVMHRLLGRTLLDHVINAARYLAPAKLVIVTGHGAEEVEAGVRASAAAPETGEHQPPPVQPVFVRQDRQLGTGHAVSMAKAALAGHSGPLVILAGDVPLVSPQTLLDFVAAHRALEARLSVLTVKLDDPAHYGRIIRDENGWLEKIVEARDATERELAVSEINSGFYVADPPSLFTAIDQLRADNTQGEYYLTDVVADFRARAFKVAAVEGPDALEVSGINDRYELAAAGAVLKDRVNSAWMRAGVTMLDPVSTYIETGARLGRDVTLWPGVVLSGQTRIGPGAVIGPHCHLDNCVVGAGAAIGGQAVLKNVAVADGETVAAGALRSASL